MWITKTIFLSAAIVGFSISTGCFAEDTGTNHISTGVKPATNSPVATGSTNVQQRAVAKQGDLASKTAEFGKTTATEETYKTAFDAHAMEDALKLVDEDGAFKGTVSKIYEPRGMAILDFDPDYRKALTAVVNITNFDKFPPLTNLIGKEVLVTGKFVKFRGSAQILLEKPEQIKVVEGAKESK